LFWPCGSEVMKWGTWVCKVFLGILDMVMVFMCEFVERGEQLRGGKVCDVVRGEVVWRIVLMGVGSSKCGGGKGSAVLVIVGKRGCVWTVVRWDGGWCVGEPEKGSLDCKKIVKYKEKEGCGRWVLRMNGSCVVGRKLRCEEEWRCNFFFLFFFVKEEK